ncbi:hypothetical protein D3C71_1787300 [compost metagenome]
MLGPVIFRTTHGKILDNEPLILYMSRAAKAVPPSLNGFGYGFWPREPVNHGANPSRYSLKAMGGSFEFADRQRVG